VQGHPNRRLRCCATRVKLKTVCTSSVSGESARSGCVVAAVHGARRGRRGRRQRTATAGGARICRRWCGAEGRSHDDLAAAVKLAVTRGGVVPSGGLERARPARVGRPPRPRQLVDKRRRSGGRSVVAFQVDDVEEQVAAFVAVGVVHAHAELGAPQPVQRHHGDGKSCLAGRKAQLWMPCRWLNVVASLMRCCVSIRSCRRG
jgi:hypothetical protein